MTSSIIILINNDQNPKRRSLIQIDRMLVVNSECCGTGISKNDIGVGYEDTCDGCGRTLGFNKPGWDSSVRGISMNTSSKAGTGRWAEWAVHWFGLHGFEIEVEE